MDLTPYVPRLVLEWAASEPERRHRTIEGTGVFADLSGFTALSERLARIGREGAEELTDVIDATFTALLEPAYEAGGSLLKFGGDALFLFFDGEDHEVRGCWAAHTMRRVLREVGKVQTPSGARTTLRMSTGVHSGSFQFFLVGSELRELLIVGAETTRMLEMEGSAATGRIVVSPELAERLPPRFVGAEHGAGYLLLRSPTAPASRLDGVISTVADWVDPTPFLAPSLSQSLGEGGDEPEHRRAAIAFARLRGLDALLAEQGADILVQFLDRFVGAITDVCEHFDVTLIASDVYPDGVKLLLGAGVPAASELSEEHLLRAVTDHALDDYRNQLQIGVHRGHLFSGSVGPPYRRTFTVMGDIVNTSARIMQHAQPGEILASPDVLDRTRAVFSVHDRRTFQAKGKRQHISVERVEGATAVGRATSSLSEFVGREDELAVLRQHFQHATVHRRGAVIDVMGDAGIGKSQLIDRALSEETAVRVIRVRCEEFAKGTPYVAALQLLSAAYGHSAADPALTVLRSIRRRAEESSAPVLKWIELLSPVLGAKLDEPAHIARLDDQARRARLSVTYLEAIDLAFDGPAILAVEDIHWLDRASATLLRALSDAAPPRGWVVLCTRRSSEPPLLENATMLELRALNPDDSRRLIRANSDRALLPRDIESIIDRADGNPLFIRELLAGHGSEGEIPDSLEGVIGERIDRLPVLERSALRVLSVLGVRAPSWIVDALVTDLGGELTRVEWRALKDFVERSPHEFSFRHALFQSVAYGALPYRRRRELHRRAAALIESNDAGNIHLIARHAHLARDFQRTIEYGRIAGEESRERFAYDEAARAYTWILDAARHVPLDPEELSTLHEQAAYMRFLAGDVVGATPGIRRARKLTTDPVRQARLCVIEGELRHRQGKHGAAWRWFERGLRELDGHTDPESQRQRIRLRVGQIWTRNQQGRPRDAIRLCNETLELVAPDDADGRKQVFNEMLKAALALRDPLATQYGEFALREAEATGAVTDEVNILNNLAIDARKRGDWSRAVESFHKARQRFEDLGRPLHAAASANNAAIILLDQGHYDAAQETFEEAMMTFEAAGSSHRLAALGNIGTCLIRSGDLNRGRQLLEEARTAFDRMGARHALLEVVLAIALSGLMDGQHANVRATLDRERSHAPPDMAPQLLRLLGYAHLQEEDLVQARASFDESLGLAHDVAARFDIALAHEALERLARITGEDPGPHEREKQAIFDELGVIRTPEIPLPEQVPTP